MSQPLAKHAYARILDMILAGTLAPGDTLQEAKLGDAPSMSRTPVRKAIKRIEAEGLAAQDGWFLKMRRLTQAQVDEIFLLRSALESHCARQAVGLAPSVIDGPWACVERLLRHGPGEDDEQRRVNDDLHGAIALSANSRTTVALIEDLRRRTNMFDHPQAPERFRLSCEEHPGIAREYLAVIDVIETRIPSRAALGMELHFDSVKSRFLACLARA